MHSVVNEEYLPTWRGGSVCLNSFGLFVKWISASIMRERPAKAFSGVERWKL